MGDKINAILIHHDDNVITAIESLKPGDTARYHHHRALSEIAISENIPKFHKVAIEDLERSQPVIKYGQLVGEAIQSIPKGGHVHDRNIKSPDRSLPGGGITHDV